MMPGRKNNSLGGLQTCLWAAVALSMVFVGASTILRDSSQRASASRSVSGEAVIVNDYTLVDQFGQTVTPDTYAGTWQMVFFGFTHCPDICPMTLGYMAEVMDALGPEADLVTPIFITVDPARDTVDVMAAYSSAFHPSLVGLTGTQAQVDAAAHSFRVWHERTEDDLAPDGYIIAHTGFIHLMRPDGRFEDVFLDSRQTPWDMAARLAALISGVSS